MSHCGVTSTATASSHQRCCIKGVRAHGIGGEGNLDGRSTSAPPGPSSVGARRMQSCLYGPRSMGPSQASPWVPASQREEGSEAGHGEWRRAGARRAPLRPSLAECHLWRSGLLLHHLCLPSSGGFCFYLTGIHTDGDSGQRVPILTEKPQSSACRERLTCACCIHSKGHLGKCTVLFSPLLHCNPNYLNHDIF